MGGNVSLIDGHIDEVKEIGRGNILKALKCCDSFKGCSRDCPFYGKAFDNKFLCLDEKRGLLARAYEFIADAEIITARKFVQELKQKQKFDKDKNAVVSVIDINNLLKEWESRYENRNRD